MSEHAAKPKAAPPPKAAAPSRAPAPKPQSPAKPALARLRRALGELITAHRTNTTHMVPVYQFHLRTALDGALAVRASASDAERTEIADLETRARSLLANGTPAAPTTEEMDDLRIDWDVISDVIDGAVPGLGPAVTQAPQLYRDLVESLTRTPLHTKAIFLEQWDEFADDWFNFLQLTIGLLAAEVGVMILAALPEPTMATKIAAIALQALLIALVIHATVKAGADAIAYGNAWWTSVKAAKGDVKMLDLAAANFVRMVFALIQALGGALGLRRMAKRGGNAPKNDDAKPTKTGESTSNPPAKAGDSTTKSSKTTGSTGSSGNSVTSKAPHATSGQATRVTEPVRGVWEQSERPGFKGPKFEDLELVEIVDDNVATTAFFRPGVRQPIGLIERAYDPVTKTFEMRNAFLDQLPSKIVPRTGTSLTTTGTPTQTYLTLRQMKALGVEYGGLKKIKMKTIQNVQSVIELEVLSRAVKKGDMTIHEAVNRTYSLTYAQTPITQSGHRIVSVKFVEGPKKRQLGQLLDHYERGNSRTKPKIKEKVDAHNALIEKYGGGVVTRETEVSWDYEIEIEVAPYHSGKNP
jgi:hypothetical protein